MKIEIIKIKKSFKPFWENSGKELKSILFKNIVLLALVMFIAIYTLNSLPLFSGLISGYPLTIVSSLIVMFFSMWILNIGLVISRKSDKSEDANILDVIVESLAWIWLYGSCYPLRVGASILIGGGIIYSGILSKIGLPWQEYSIVGVLVVVLMGLLGKGIGSIYMSEDGEVSKTIKGKTRVSVSLTLQRVKEYNKLNNKNNQIGQLSVIIFFNILMMVMSFNALILPFVLLVGSVLNYLLYKYSFEKVSKELSPGGEFLLVVDAGVDIDDGEDEDDISMENIRDKGTVDRANGNGGLSKEKILGEHWYLNDKPSVIPEDKDDETEEEQH